MAGYYVECFIDSSSFLKFYKPLFYDLLLLDVKMGELSGFEVAEAIRLVDKSIKICFLSAFKNYFDSLLSEYPNLDFRYFIQKPIRKNELLSRIKSLDN